MTKAQGKVERSLKVKDGSATEKKRQGGNADAAPSFSDAMVANMTKRIEQKLQGNSSENGTSRKADKKPKPEMNETRKKRDPIAETKPTAEPKAVDKPAKKREQFADIKPIDKAGKKRDRSGKIIKPQVVERPQLPEKSQTAGPGKTLEEEVYAIGGTKEDLELVAGAESDSEMEDKEISNGDLEKLRKDLGRLINGGNELPDIEDPPAKEKMKPTKTKEEKKDEKEEKKKLKKLDKKLAEERIPEKTPLEKTNPEAASVKRDSKKSLKKDAPIAGTAPIQESQAPKKTISSSSNLVIPDRSDWYSTPLPEISYDASHSVNISRQVLERVREYAMTLLEADNKAYLSNKDNKSSSYKFYSTIVSSGTLSDKISALTLSAQESPLHNTQALETLVGLAKKRSRAQAVEVLRSLKDLFAQGTLLPGDRRLKHFVNQPALAAALAESGGNWDLGDRLPKQIEKSHLIMWAFEDFVKEQYFEVLKVLEVWCNDEIEFSRSRALSYVYELLKEKPEQESNLLRLLVNKLGDPSKKIASRASYLLLQLEQAHPLMKGTIVSSIESESLFRPGQSQHAKYYGVITLNQTILSTADNKVASQLLDIYFPLFVALLKPKKEAHTQGKKKKDKKDKSAKRGKKGPSKEEDEIAKGEAQDEELREKLVSAVLVGVNRAYPFTTSSFELLSKHLDTLFRITNSSNFNTSIQALMLIQQLSSSHAVSADRFYRTLYESLLDPRIATSSKQSMYLNLLYKALNADINIKRIKAFVKRLIQILGMHNPSFSCGVLYLIRQLESTFPALTALVDQPEDPESDDDEEVFKDVPEEGEEEVEEDKEEVKKQASLTRYDARKRDPERSNADKSCLWELLPYLSHFHPSVAISAKQLLSHEKMSGKPDLTIHTLTHFLDRFVYKTPKATPGLRGSSIMQPLAGGDSSGLLVTSGRSAAQQPVNSESFWRKRSDEVSAEDVFFHDYFNRLGKDKLRQKSKKKTTSKGDDEDESDGESEVWKALVQSQPELDGEGGSDDDMDMDGFDSAMEASDDGFEDMGVMDDDMDEEDREIDDGVIINEESSEEEEEEREEKRAPKGKAGVDKRVEVDDDVFNFDQSDDEAFLDSDEELPSDLDMDVDEPEDTSATKSQSQSKREKRRKLKHLPTFASAEDYAALLGKDVDEDF
ncbi:hypothetical protein FQN49_002580 [Arthroderma sp. PD_2]|nr:hypothetical protein FQN49_002580 [Arthroderma sp. PD_2]